VALGGSEAAQSGVATAQGRALCLWIFVLHRSLRWLFLLGLWIIVEIPRAKTEVKPVRMIFRSSFRSILDFHK
jgi:hypothetical protein